MTPEQQRQQQASKKGGRANSGQTIGTATRSIFMLTLVTLLTTIFLQAFWGKGDEVKCGSGVSDQLCYLPGLDWLGYAVMLSVALTVVSFMLLAPDKDK